MSVAKDTTTINWYVVNSRRDLMNAIAQVRQALMRRIEQRQGKETEPIAIALPEEEEDAPPSALTQLCQIFRLSGFERDVLLLCAGMELDDQWGALCAEAQGEAQQTYPTFGLAWALSAEPNLAALRPDAPLRGWRLIEVGEGMSRLKCPLRIDERIFDYLWGDDYIDSRLRGIVQPLSVEAEDYAVLPPSHQQIVAQIAATWVESSRTVLPVIGLSGVDGLSKSAIAAAVCRQLNLNLHRFSVAALTPQVGSLSLVKQLCEREWLLSQSVLFLEGDEMEEGMLREMVVQVQQRGRVYETWGFAQKNQRGLGINALFPGMSGTGKTLAAEVLGNTLRLDVYRIDLSAVVSKYIGETEKNLRRIFDGAEGCGAILLFDEADALFGKRSEVKDSHDRHANIEVSYLLQRMETYRGLAILTTNIQTGLDQAFIRRIRFIVKFPYPGAKEREEIWRRVFPEATPTEGLDFKKLGKLHMAGGNIKTIAMNAAFLAAGAGEAVQMKHIKQAAIQECLKLERPMGQGELQGW